MGKRILVAGGCGFIGSHACERLLEQGHRVVCVDNLMTGVIRGKVSRHPNWYSLDYGACFYCINKPYVYDI